MSKYLLLIGSVILIASPATAPPPCSTGTLDTYIQLGSGGCLIGRTLFRNFVYQARARNGAQPIPPSEITVTPHLLIPATSGLQFQAAWHADAGQIQESFIGYQVLLIPPPGPVTQPDDLALEATGMQAGTFGSVSVREMTSAGKLAVFLECVEVCQSKPADTIQFTFVPPLDVSDAVILRSKQGTSSLASFTALIDLCPACV